MGKSFQYANLSSGDVIPFSVEGGFYIDQDTNIEALEKAIDLNYVTSTFKIYVL